MSMQRGSNREPRPKQKTPAERGVEFAAAQRRLKAEAAERRSAAAEKTASADQAAGRAPAAADEQSG